eukprot:11021305-Ditylum_brightwellii.AAC.1
MLQREENESSCKDRTSFNNKSLILIPGISSMEDLKQKMEKQGGKTWHLSSRRKFPILVCCCIKCCKEERMKASGKTGNEFSARRVETEDGESRRENRTSLIKKPVPSCLLVIVLNAAKRREWNQNLRQGISQ